jgi:hypothetical protein
MDKTIKLLDEFLKDYTMEGACGFWVQPDEDGGIPSVYIIFDLDWLQSLQTKPDFVARRMRQGLKEDIKNWTGVDVPYVGSTAKKCDNTKDINESVSTYLRRRFSFEDMKENIDSIVDYGEFIIHNIKKVEHLSGYLRTRFTLTNGVNPHELRF